MGKAIVLNQVGLPLCLAFSSILVNRLLIRVRLIHYRSPSASSFSLPTLTTGNTPSSDVELDVFNVRVGTWIS
ncbi:hypothetical protein H0H81_002260 [Sphagnurus paluster]|uniref:Uncharacterized protein n=1 Tax=Sphagnurus paluster TaxID=117069 RepID=A0A9P7KJX7_9AGAR|nr:hypothetical protein H0H81_002260 [Sphagnurus paluster]